MSANKLNLRLRSIAKIPQKSFKLEGRSLEGEQVEFKSKKTSKKHQPSKF